MDPNFEIYPVATEPAVGDVFDLSAELINIWTGQQLDMFVTLDISAAPSLRFVGGQDPVDQTVADAISFEPAAPDPLNPDQNFLTEPSRTAVQVEVPSGATALRIELIPDDASPQSGADLAMRLYDARSDPEGDPVLILDEAGQGGSEVFRAPSAGEVATGGFGTWIIEAETTLQKSGLQDPQNIGFSVRMDAWFNLTEETQQVIDKAGPVTKGSREIFVWSLSLIEQPAEGEEIRVYANATTFYDHLAPKPDGGKADYANITVMNAAPLVPTQNGTYQVGLELADIVVSDVPLGEVTMAAISEAIGYAATMLLLASIITGGIFGKATRRWQNNLFGSARRRVAFHNFLSYGIIGAAIAHTTIFVIDSIEPNYPWQLGLLWGGLAILCMFGLGVTGAVQVPMIRRWNYSVWRWTHFSLTIGAIVFTLVHMMLDGQNFGFIQEAIGYEDPISPADQR